MQTILFNALALAAVTNALRKNVPVTMDLAIDVL